MNFISNQLFNGQWFRLLTLVENFSHEGLAIQVEGQPNGDDVVTALDRIKAARDCPQSIRVDIDSNYLDLRTDRLNIGRDA